MCHAGRRPTIFVFTPYRARFRDDKGQVVEAALGDGLALRSLLRAGYVVAVADIRGKGASFGHRRGFQDRTEARDGYDLIEWLARRPYSTGAVGMIRSAEQADHIVRSGQADLVLLAMGFVGPRKDGVVADSGVDRWSPVPGRGGDLVALRGMRRPLSRGRRWGGGGGRGVVPGGGVVEAAEREGP